MRQRSALRNAVEYCLAATLLKSLQYTPLPIANALARMYTRALDRAIPRLRRVAERNLGFAMPELTPARHAEVVHGVFRSIARILVSFARFPSIRRDTLDSWIRLEGGEHFEAAQRAGRGVLFATAHLGNWEISAFAHALMTAPMHVLVRPLDNPRVDKLVEQRRALSGNYIIRKKQTREVLRALAAGDAVGVLIDQNVVPSQGVFVEFFGKKACAHAGFAKLAHHTGAAVVPGFALWSEEEQLYVLRFYPEIAITGDVTADTQRIHAHLESV